MCIVGKLLSLIYLKKELLSFTLLTLLFFFTTFLMLMLFSNFLPPVLAELLPSMLRVHSNQDEEVCCMEFVVHWNGKDKSSFLIAFSVKWCTEMICFFNKPVFQSSISMLTYCEIPYVLDYLETPFYLEVASLRKMAV